MIHTTLIVALFVGLSSAEYGWKAGTKYDYSVEGRTLTGLHQVADQYSGVLFRAKLTVQAKTDDLLSAQIIGAEFANLHANLSGGWTTHVPDERLNYEQLPIQRQAFELKLNNGVITDITVNKNLPLWEVNFIKSIASPLQLDTQGVNQKKSSKNQVPHGDEVLGLYKTMEDSINGIYETEYEVSPLPESVVLYRPELVPIPHLKGQGRHIEIVKNRNFANAKQHLVHRFGWNGCKAGTNQMGDFLSRTSVSRVIISGNWNRYIIQSSVTNEKVILAPHLDDDQEGIVASRMNLTLEAVSTAQEEAPQVSNPLTLNNLVFEGAHEGRHEHGHDKNIEQPWEESSSSSSSEEGGNVRRVGEEINSSKIRPRRSLSEANKITIAYLYELRKNGQSSGRQSSESSSSNSSSESSQSTSSSEEYLEPNPSMQQSPKNLFMPSYEEIRDGGKVESSVERVVRIAREIANGIEEPNSIIHKNTLTWFQILSRVIASMSADQMSETTQKLYRSENQRENSRAFLAWVAFRDGVAQAGTGPALVTLRNWISSGKVQGEEAAELIAVLPQSARYPNTEYMNYFFDLLKDKAVQRQMHLNNSALLAFTELIRKAQIDYDTAHNHYPIHLYKNNSGSLYRVIKEQYIPYLQKQLKNAIQEGVSGKIQTHIRALGNIAHPQIIGIFKPYLEGTQKVSNFQRLMMVVSLDEMARLYPDSARPVLYRIYKNQGDKAEIRVAAVMLLMKTNPPAQMLQQMAQQTNSDVSKQVNAAVKSAIQTAAKAQDNVDNFQLSQNARSAVDMLTPENFGGQYSRNEFMSVFGYNHLLSYIQGGDSIVPSSLFYNVWRNLGGYKNGENKFSYITSSASEPWELLSRMFGRRTNRKAAMDSNSGQSSEGDTPDLSNWKMQLEQSEGIEGSLLGSFLGGQRLFTFDNNTIEELPMMLGGLYSTISGGQQFNLTKLYNRQSLEVAFVLATGFPFVYSLHAPTLVKVGAQARGEETEPLKQADYQLLYSTKKHGSLGFITPFNQERYVAAFVKNVHLHLPIRSEIDIDISEANRVEINVQMEPLNRQDGTKLLEASSVAYTSRVSATTPEPHLRSENTEVVRRSAVHPNRGQGSNGQLLADFGVDLKIETDLNLGGINALKDPSQLFDKFWQNNIHNSNISVTFSPEKSIAKKVKFSWAVVRQQTSEEQSQDNENDHKYTRTHQMKTGGNVNVPVPTRPENEERRKEFLKNVVEGIPNAEASLMDASVTFEGQRTAKYVLSAAYANSHTSKNNRLMALLSWRPTSSSQDEKPREVTVQVNGVFPKVPVTDYKNALNMDPTSKINGQIEYRKDSQSQFQINIKGTLQRTKERLEYLRQHQISKECEKEMSRGNKILSACQNVTLNANCLNYYHFTVEQQGLQYETSELYELYYRVTDLAFPYVRESNVSSGQKEVSMDVRIVPDFSSAEVSILTPRLNVHSQNIPLGQMAIPLVVLHPSYSPIQRLSHKLMANLQTSTCSLDLDEVNTFNNRTYHIELGKCWHTLVTAIHNQNSPSNPEAGLGIFARDIESNQREVIVILGGSDQIKLTPSGLEINGEKKQISSEQTVKWSNGQDSVEIYSLPERDVVVEIPTQGVQIVYDGVRARLSLQNNWRGRTRGLCGAFDGEPMSDLKSPQECILTNPSQFAASFAINDQSCEGPAKQIQQMVQTSPCYKKQIVFGEVVSDSELQTTKTQMKKNNKKVASNMRKNEEEEKESCFSYKVMVIEDSGKTCFSVRPQMSCGSGCQPSSKIEKMLDFHCLSDSAASRHWTKMVAKGANPDFTQKGANLRTAVRLPEQCVPTQ